MKEKIGNISQVFQDTGSEPQILSVRRRKLWQDTAQKLGRLYANCITTFSVPFIGEAGIDARGPTREFFSLLFDDCKKHLFATGDGSSFTLLHDVEKVRKEELQLLGNLISIALLCGCAGPRCFIPSVTAHSSQHSSQGSRDSTHHSRYSRYRNPGEINSSYGS